MKKEIKLSLSLLFLCTSFFLMGCVDDLTCTASSNGSYQNLTTDELNEYITNYKNNIWSHSCNQLNNSRRGEEQSGNNAETEYEDARCVEYNLNDLQNYLCTIQNTDLDGEVVKLRFYYIQYPSLDEQSSFTFNQEYAGMHSIAIVPVVNNNGVEEERYKNTEEQSVIANHGHLIPPPNGSPNILNGNN